jgi:hypothetical protein
MPLLCTSICVLFEETMKEDGVNLSFGMTVNHFKEASQL